MKLSAIIILSTAITAAANGHSQTVTLDLKKAPVQKVFKEVMRQTGVSIVYAEALFKDLPPVNIKVKDAPVTEVMNLVLGNSSLVYFIEGSTIVIKPKESIPNLSRGNESLNNLPPPIDITGKVTDENGNPLAGASVKVKGSNKGTTTNNDGVFVLKGVDDNAVLEISYVGFEQISIPVSNRTSIVTSLKAKPENLNEVIINKGYYAEKQKYSVGNATHIDGKVIEQQPVQNPLLALQGRVPGLEITQLSGINGGGVTVRIQGQNSINSGLEPLIVIDGVPYPSILTNTFFETVVQGGSPLNYINSADIESIDVLKDADATAIYGSRAGNGAILITTKKGKVGKPKVIINLQQGWGKVTRRADMMNSRQYLDMRYEALKNDGLFPSSNPLAAIPYIYAPDLTIWDTTRNADWQKSLIGGTAQYTNIGATLTGGTSVIQYLVGGAYNRQSTVFPGNFDDKKGSIHFNINGIAPDQRFSFQFSGSYGVDVNRLPGIDLTSNAVFLAPIAPNLFNADGTINWAPNAAGSSTWLNPLASSVNTSFNNTTKNLVSSLMLRYKLVAGLELVSNFGYTSMQADVNTQTRLGAYSPESTSATRTSNFGNRNMSSWNIEPQLQYKTTLLRAKIEGLVGTTMLQNNSRVLSLSGSNYSNDLSMNDIGSAGTISLRTSYSAMYKYNAVFSRLNFNWNDKYIVNLTARRDGSSRFGENNKFHNFAGVGIGWVFSKQKWVSENIPVLSFGKLRASFGTTGNDQINDYTYLSLYSNLSGLINYQNLLGIYVTRIPNPNLEWEETKKWQAGIDLGFVNDRLRFTGTYSLNRSSNQLISYVLPTVTGFSSITKNFPATIQNTSWEFSVSTSNINRHNFSWTSSVNLTIPRNKLISFPNIGKTSYGASTSTTIIGKPLNLTRLYPNAGIDAATGKYIVYDRNGNPTSTPVSADKTSLLSTRSDFYGGVQNGFVIRGFQLDFLFQFVRQKGQKQLYYYGLIYPGRYDGTTLSGSNQPVSVMGRWQKSGDNSSIGRYAAGATSISTISNSDALYDYDASYVRIKNVSLSWQLPGKWLPKGRQKQTGQNVQLYFRGENLMTFTKYSGLDPESQSVTALPPLQMWTVGAKLEF